METIIGWVILILGLGVVILVHELGHASIGILFKVPIVRIMIGIPSLFKFKIRDVRWSVGPLMILGAVEFHESIEDFAWWKRFLIVFAGPVISIVTGFFIIQFLVRSQLVTFEQIRGGVDIIFPRTNDLCAQVGWFGTAYGFGTLTHSPLIIIALFAFLSIMVGLLNLVPIPPLDGGQMLMIIISALFGPKIKNFVLILTVVGALLLIGVTIFDLGIQIWQQGSRTINNNC